MNRPLDHARTAIESALAWLSSDAILRFFERQRWYGAKGAAASTARVLDGVVMPWGLGAFAIARITLDVNGESRTYQVPLAARDAVPANLPESVVVARGEPAGKHLVVYDALYDPDFRQGFVRAIRTGLTIPADGGPKFVIERAVPDVPGGGNPPSRIGTAEQSNTSLIIGDDAILKLFRILNPGPQPDVEVSLFVGPRAAWDVGVQATTSSGKLVGMSLRGADQLRYAVDDVARACELGLRSVLVSDLGLLSVLGRLRERGDLPTDLVLKVSVSLPAANPATARVLEDLGATTINLPVDLTLAQLAAMRAAIDVPLDLYIETTDDFGGLLRYHEIPEIIRVADSPAVRVLDLVVVTLDEQNRPDLVEFDTIPGLEGVRDSATRRRVLLSQHDIELVCLSLGPGECAIILVAEDRWAQPLAAAARALGGEVRAGERIARNRVEATLQRAAEQPEEG